MDQLHSWRPRDHGDRWRNSDCWAGRCHPDPQRSLASDNRLTDAAFPLFLRATLFTWWYLLQWIAKGCLQRNGPIMSPSEQPCQCHPAQNQPTCGRWMRKGLPVPGEYKHWMRHGVSFLPLIASWRGNRFQSVDDDSVRGTARPNFNADALTRAAAEDIALKCRFVFDSVFIEFFYGYPSSFW